jgi:tetratricopeptide (TPR) repeat protein
MSRSLLAAALLVGFSVPAARARNAAVAVQAGDAALAKFDLDGAIHSYRIARQLQPDNFDASWRLARALLDKGTLTGPRDQQKPLFVEAEQLTRQAVTLQPRHPKGHVFLAIAVGKLALFEGGKRKVELSKEVKAEAAAALVLEPNEDLAHHVLGVWHREMIGLNFVLRKFAEMFYGRLPPASWAESEEHLRRAATLAPDNLAHRVELGITLHAAGKRAAATTTFQEALKMPNTWVTDDH